MADWLRELKQYADSNIVILLVGNKTDLKDRREVRKEEAAAYADQHQLAFVETSALDCSNVDLAFDRIINEIYKVVSQQAVADEDGELPSSHAASSSDPQDKSTGGTSSQAKAGTKLHEKPAKGDKQKKKGGCCK